MSKKIFFTGGTGYLGRHLVNHFHHKGHEIFCFVRKTSNLENLKAISNKIVFVTEDSLDSLPTVDIFIHTATAYGRKGETDDEIFKTNKELPLSLLKRIFHSDLFFINTDTSLPTGLNAYSTSKKDFISEVKDKFPHLKVANLICEQFYGPDDGTFLTFVRESLEKGEKIKMTSGTQKRDFLFIEDLVFAYEIVFNNQINLSPEINDIPVGSGESFPIREIATLAADVLQKDSGLFEWGAIPMRENEVMNSVADITYLEKLGWKPQTSLKKGMEISFKL